VGRQPVARAEHVAVLFGVKFLDVHAGRFGRAAGLRDRQVKFLDVVAPPRLGCGEFSSHRLTLGLIFAISVLVLGLPPREARLLTTLVLIARAASLLIFLCIALALFAARDAEPLLVAGAGHEPHAHAFGHARQDAEHAE